MKPACGGWIVTCALVLSIPSHSHAQESRLRFSHLSVEQGLSHAWVHSILKDSRGFLWFGTQDGLNRYDGTGIKVYRHDPLEPGSLPSSVAQTLLEDSKKRLWVGSGWGLAGIALYDREHDRFRRFLPNPGTLGPAAGNDVQAILEDRQGRLWLGTDDGIVLFNPEAGAFERFSSVPKSDTSGTERYIISLLEDRAGRLWAGSNVGLLQFERQTGQYQRWRAPSPELAGLTRAEVWDLYEDEDGGLWAATMGAGLFRLDPSRVQGTRYSFDPHNPDGINSNRVRRLNPGGEGRLYVGTEGGGLNILDLRTRKFTHAVADPEDATSPRSSSVWSLHLDDQGILWMGTYNGGADQLSPWSQRFGHLRPRRGGLNDSHVNAVMEDHRGNLWIGTDEGGLNKLDRRTGAYTYYRHDPGDRATIGSNSVWALLEDSQRDIWVGSWAGGLARLNPVTGQATRFRRPRNPASTASDSVWRILELRTGELLVVTQTGADLFDRRTGVFTRLSGPEIGTVEGVLFSAAEEKDGSLWLVGSGFVGHFDRRAGQTKRYRHDPKDPHSLGSGWTQAVLVDSAGNVWLGSEGGLSCVEAKTRAMRRFTMADGLPSNTVSSIVEDGSGSLWLGTNSGLSKLVDAVRVPDSPTFLNFDVHDGLQGNEFARNTSYRSRSGRLFFGGPQGLNWFDPHLITRNVDPPPVILTDFKIFNRSIRVGAPGSPLDKAITETSELTLSYRQSMVAFEFAALNFVVPQKNQYAYRLVGFDPGWNEVGTQRTATYTNLPAGDYTLRVWGSNNDGIWNNEGVSLKIHVTPPWWKTRWFAAALVLAALGMGVGAHRWRVRQHVRVERELQERVKAAMADIKTLRGLLPICAWCKKVRDDSGYWSRLEEYVSERTDAAFSHGICPECREQYLRESRREGAGG